MLVHPRGPLGHSDGDAVLHAIADALLGAAGLDDLGTLFPDSDARWKDAPSAQLLAEALRRVEKAGYRPLNVDVVVTTEGPRIAPHRARMRASLARLRGLEADAVNVKGKSLEGLGALAGGLGVAVQAVCLLEAAGKPSKTAERAAKRGALTSPARPARARGGTRARRRARS